MSRKTDRTRLLVGLALAAALAACSDDEKPAPVAMDEPDASANNGTPPGPDWTLGTLEEGGVGYQPDLVVLPDGTPAAAYYVATGQDAGPCPNFGDGATDGVRWPIHYATLDGASWSVEVVAEPFFLGQPPGLSLAVGPDGAPAIAALSGDPLGEPQRYCGANDVGLYTRTGTGTWDVTTAVTSSGQAASGQPGSDFGEVVGYWPSLAFDNDGAPAIAYKDVHSGSIQSDDLRRADLELAWRRGGWDAIPVVIGKGSGDFNRILFDADNNPYIAYYTPWETTEGSNLGVWMTRSVDGGTTWESVQLFTKGTAQGPDTAFDADGTLHLIFYNSTKGFPQLATLDDPDAFTSVSNGWSLQDLGDSRYDEGYASSIALSPTGALAVAYYRCGRAVNGLGECSAAEDALVFVWRDGATWIREVVDNTSDGGQCGQKPSLAFDATGRAVIAYTCEVFVDGALEPQMKYAIRKALP